MKFTKIPATMFQNIQLNAGILLDDFTPSTGEIGSIVGATSGGVNFVSTPTFSDFGEDIDNCPKNMKELKNQDDIEATMSGTFVSVTAALAKMLIGAADIDANDSTHVVPRRKLEQSDFTDLWWVGDYSDKNGDTKGGFCAIHLMNALSTGGFQIQSTDKAKGAFAFTFTGHFSMENQEQVPYEIYIQEGDDEVPIEYTYTAAELTNGFEYGVTYYTRSGSSPNYVYTEVAAGSKYDSETTYYTRSIA